MLPLFFSVAFAATVASSTNAYAKERVMEEFAEIPAMIDVAYCESRFRQFNGTTTEVLRGELTPADVGIMQINERYHLKRARSMGIDIHTVDGNIAYAKVLYLESGLQSWSASHDCMNKQAKLRQQLASSQDLQS